MVEQFVRTVALVCLVTWNLGMGNELGAQNPQRLLRPPAIVQPLQSRCRISTSDPDLRELADRIGRQCEVELIVSRRVDPNLEAAIRESQGNLDLGPTLRDACDQIAKAAGCQWATDGNVIWMAPSGEAVSVMTSVLSLRQSLASDNTFSKEWQRSYDFEIKQLSEPNEVLDAIRTKWPELSVDVSLPYDLLHGEVFGKVDFPLASGLLVGGFGRALEPDSRTGQLRLRKLDEVQPVTIAYPQKSLTQQAQAIVNRELRQRDGGTLKSTSNALILQGDAMHHLALQLQLWKVDGAAQAGRQQLTFRFRNYARVGFEKLADAGSYKLTSDASVKEAMEQVVDVELKGDSIEQLLEQLGAEVGLDVIIKGTQVTLQKL